MKRKVLICSLVVALIGIGFLSQQLSYPPSWDVIQLGMSRQQVYELAGPPTVDTTDLKGAFWFKRKLAIHQELQVFFEGDKAVGFYVAQYIGTDQHFAYKRIIRSS